MSIAAKRFSVFDTDTNLPTSDLTGLEYGGVLNTDLAKDIGDLTGKFEDITKTLFDNKDALAQELQAKFDENVLEVKGILGSVKDFSKATTAEMDAAIRDLFPSNPVAQSIFSQMSDKCRRSALTNQGFGKPFDIGYNCGSGTKASGNKACTSSSFSNLLNQLTGGAYGGIFQDLNSSLKALMGLASFGYRMNMCGVFNALSSGLGLTDKGFLSRAGAGVLSVLSNIKKPLGVFDLASTTAALGLNIKAELPNAAKAAFSSVAGNFFPAKDLEQTGERLLASASIFDADYNDIDILEANSDALRDIVDTQAFNQPFSLTTPKVDDLSLTSVKAKLMDAVVKEPPQYMAKCGCLPGQANTVSMSW